MRIVGEGFIHSKSPIFVLCSIDWFRRGLKYKLGPG